MVLYSRRGTAVKFFVLSEPYLRERNAYLLFRGRGITHILQFQLPELERYDDDLMAVEMSMVPRPGAHLLDFAGAYPAVTAPDFPPEVMDEWMSEKAEQFGDCFPDVLRVLDELRRLTGLVMVDIHPGNISFG